MVPIQRPEEHLRNGTKELERLLGGSVVGSEQGAQERKMQTLGEACQGWKASLSRLERRRT